jgi:hypothetical protein
MHIKELDIIITYPRGTVHEEKLEFITPSGGVCQKVVLSGHNMCGKTRAIQSLHDICEERDLKYFYIDGSDNIWICNYYKENYHNPNKYKSDLSSIKKYCTELFGDDTMIARDDLNEVTISYKNENGKDVIMGYISPSMKIMAAILDCAAHKESPDVLLIDHIECLHPEWQTDFHKILREFFPNTQIFIATNSGSIWDYAMSWERFLMVPPSDPRRRLYVPVAYEYHDLEDED